MKIDKSFLFIFIIFTSLGSIAPEAGASVYCGVFQGANCEVPLYYMKFCADITLRQGYCNDLCAQQKPVCNVEDFSPWVKAYQDIGRRGIQGELLNHTDEFDEDGQLVYLSEKAVTVCHRTPRGDWTPWRGRPQTICPKAKQASADACEGGTVFDSTSGLCVTEDATGDSGTSDFQNLMKQSSMLVSTQNQHFGLIPATDRNLNFSAITADKSLAGLVSDTKAGGLKGELGALSAEGGASNSPGKKVPSSDSKASSGGGANSLASTASTTAVTDKGGVNPDQVFDSVKRAAKDAYASLGGGNANGASGSGSWFSGNSGSATAGSASGVVDFEKKSDQDSVLAARKTLNIEDPENYFLMTDIEISLFKRVTAQCRKKEKELVLALPGL